MGFINPGKSKRKRSTDPAKKSTKKLKRELSPQTALISQSRSKLSSTPIIKEEPKLSIIERFPTEILHEIFVFCNEMNSLPFVNKNVHSKFTFPSHSLKLKMIRNYIYDLDNEITHHSVKHHFKNRYALDKTILNYNLITPALLNSINFDIVLSLPTIKAESKNRLILYHDKLNKKLLETMYSSNTTAEEMNQELSRMAEERFNMTMLDEELSDLPNEEYQDYSETFYNPPFSDSKLEVIELLHSKEVRFTNGETILCNAIKSGYKEDVLKRLLDCTEMTQITSISPIIECFEQNDLELVSWCIDNLSDENLISHDDLWIYLSKQQNMRFLNFMESKGSVPSHQILGYLNSLHK